MCSLTPVPEWSSRPQAKVPQRDEPSVTLLALPQALRLGSPPAPLPTVEQA